VWHYRGVDAGRDRDEVRGRTEAWFVRCGVPHFIDDYSAARDVLTRAVPLLSLVFVVEVFGAANFEWPWWANALAIVGGLGILLAAWVGANLLRRRSALARPRHIGAPEIAVFVLVPALLPLAFGGQVVSAVVTAAANLGILAAVYLGTSYAVLRMSRWAFVRVGRQLGGILRLLVRALPLLLLFVIFLFLQNEVWQTTADLTGPWYWILDGFLALLGVLFLATRLPREVAGLSRFSSWDEIADLARGTPIEPVSGRAPAAFDVPPLSRREWGNVLLVALFSQGLQIVLVAALIGLVLTALGMITVSPALVSSWTGAPVHELVSLDLFGRTLVLTEQMLRVAGFLAAFSALYVTVSAVTDEAYRAEFYDDLAEELRRAFAVRAIYRATVARAAQAETSAGPPSKLAIPTPTKG
jgi:hypothetical protein